MKFTSVCLLSLLCSLAVATPVALHLHHQHAKREAAIVTVYESVYWDGTSPLPSSSTYSSAVGLPSSVQVVPSVSFTPSSIINSYEDTSSTATSLSSSSSSSSDSTSTSTATGIAGIAANNAKGITYSPYTSSGSCKSSSDIQSDIAKLAGFEIIRIYAPDCSVVENILQSKSSSQKLFAGLFYVDSMSSDISTYKSAVEQYGSWDDIMTVSVGNEWVNAGTYSVSQVRDTVTTARSLLKEAGYTGDIVSVDTLVAVQNNPDLCDISDYIAVNCHPYFSSIEASTAGSWLAEQISSVKATCGGSKEVLITESGWPSQGDSIGSSVPSLDNQYSAVKSIVETCGSQVFAFTMYNDFWKDPGQYGVEQYWGLFGDSPA